MTVAFKERPILFQDDMVNAILKELKRHTRRLNGLKQINERSDAISHVTFEDGMWCFWYGADCYKVKCPYGEPGDHLWVREAWQPWIEEQRAETIEDTVQDFIRFRADQAFVPDPKCDESSKYFVAAAFDPRTYEDKWRASIHMPKWACRLKLEITDVRVERVQEISEPDAVAEGIEPISTFDPEFGAVAEFQKLWDSINGKTYPWESNPWVWVVEFKRLEQ